MPVERSSLIKFLRGISIFRDIDENKLDLLINRLEIVTRQNGEIICKQGDRAMALYLIFSGGVKLTRKSSGREAAYMILTHGDLFGFEIFSRGEALKVTARASEQTVLLSLPYSTLTGIIKQIPVLSNRLKIRVDSYHLAQQVKLKWREPNEAIYYISRRHPFFLARRFIGPFMFGFLALIIFSLLVVYHIVGLGVVNIPTVIVGLFFLGYCIWEYIDWTNDYSIITSQRVYFVEKIVFLYDSRREALLTAIRSVDTFVSQLGLVLGFGDVIVRTFAGDIYLERIKYVKEVAALLDEQRRRALSTMTKEDIESFKEMILQRKGKPVGQSLTSSESSSEKVGKNKKPVYLHTRRTNFMHMRFEEGGTVTYRTHIFILFKKVWFLLALLGVLFALVIAGLRSSSGVMSTSMGCSVWITGVAILGMGLLAVILYRAEDWRNDIYVISNEQVIDRTKKPVGREEVTTANLSNVEAVRFVQKGFFALLFNYGTIYIRVGLQELHFDNIYNPSDVQRELFRRIALRENARRQEAMTLERERVADWIEAFNQVVSSGNPKPPETDDS